MPDCVLVTDSGVPAVRVLAALQARGIKAVSVHTAADAGARHATLADESVLLGETTSAYGDPQALVEAARQVGASAVHPGAADVPGLEQAVTEAGMDWLGGPLQVPVTLSVVAPVSEARAGTELTTLPVLPPRAVEVVTGLDLVRAALEGEVSGIARDGVALSVEVTASALAPVQAWQVPDGEGDDRDVWVDSAVEAGTDPVDPLLAVLTVWGPDRDSAYARAAAAWDRLVIEGPVVRRPAALEGKTA
ncbi:MAG: biotin carboxylase N-terminal domain-containing protein [Mycobacteriales bacterium]